MPIVRREPHRARDRREQLRDLTADDLDDWLERKAAELATSTLQQVLSILRRSITLAQRRDLVVRNVADLVTAPKGTAGRPSKALTMDQADAVLTASSRSRLHAYIVLSLLTGIRTEEARALTWDRVHLQKVGEMPPHIEVWRSVRAHGDTKTKKSRRTLQGLPERPETPCDLRGRYWDRTSDLYRVKADSCCRSRLWGTAEVSSSGSTCSAVCCPRGVGYSVC